MRVGITAVLLVGEGIILCERLKVLPCVRVDPVTVRLDAVDHAVADERVVHRTLVIAHVDVIIVVAGVP